ncbi:hypothetical protein M434DRAFT_134679 [Hypoxylon sp. CO27-5]|nr:hypothetical protein M434DRAFT_134679 [Hypoxylon sp. CO27-5]
MSRLSSFTLFSNLPPELRLQIWREAIREEKEDYCFLFEILPGGSLIMPGDQISPFLAVSRESRAVALEARPTKVRVLFRVSPEMNAVDYEWKGCIYVDFEDLIPASMGEPSREISRLRYQQYDIFRVKEWVRNFANF